MAHKLEEEALLEEEAGAARAHAHAVEAVQATHIASINWAGDCKMRHVRIDKHLGSQAQAEDPPEPATDKGAQRARAATAAAPPSAAADASAGACREHTAEDASAGACGEHSRGAHTSSTQKRSYISPPELHREICRRVRLLSFTAQFPCFTSTHAQTLDACGAVCQASAPAQYTQLRRSLVLLYFTSTKVQILTPEEVRATG